MDVRSAVYCFNEYFSPYQVLISTQVAEKLENEQYFNLKILQFFKDEFA